MITYRLNENKEDKGWFSNKNMFRKEMREMEKAEKELSTQYSEERSTATPQNSQEDEVSNKV